MKFRVVSSRIQYIAIIRKIMRKLDLNNLDLDLEALEIELLKIPKVPEYELVLVDDGVWCRGWAFSGWAQVGVDADADDVDDLGVE